MIARIWHGRTSVKKADEYFDFLERRALPDYRDTPGNLGAFVMRRDENDIAHFLTVSHWESLDAIATFAGDDLTLAKYYPEDPSFLLEFETRVHHYNVRM